MNTPKQRPYSLKALQGELNQRLRPSPGPALATLKKWSASGMIPWPDLSAAASAMETSIRSGALNLRGPRDPLAASTVARLAEVPSASRDGRGGSLSDELPGTDPFSLEALGGVLVQNQAILSRLQESVLAIAEVAQSLRAGPHREAPPPAGHDEALLSAINQLDSTRKHLLLQWDAYRQTLIKEASQHVGKSEPTGGPDFLDWQRIQARLSRIEQTLDRIETRQRDDHVETTSQP